MCGAGSELTTARVAKVRRKVGASAESGFGMESPGTPSKQRMGRPSLRAALILQRARVWLAALRGFLAHNPCPNDTQQSIRTRHADTVTQRSFAIDLLMASSQPPQ